ncbi:MAG: hypothetical protein ACFFCV_10150 [Promethearchaeota archaeon]
MIYVIFYIDWIFIDTIIIILLFLLLLSVKLFKRTHRWRNSFSNQSLEQVNLPKAHNILKNQFVFIKKWSCTRNSSLDGSNYPLLLIIRTKGKRKLMRILTEGLCSYGFNVLNLKIQIKNISQKAVSEKNIITDWNSIIYTTIDFCKKSKVIIEPSYILISLSKFLFSFNQILSNNNNLGMILINPKINKQNLKNYANAIKEFSSKPQIYNIFSKYSVFLLKNYNFVRFLNKFDPQVTNILKISTINKAKKSFKNYETIVLSILIDIIENISFNSNNRR